MREVALLNTKSYKVTLFKLVCGKVDGTVEQNTEIRNDPNIACN